MPTPSYPSLDSSDGARFLPGTVLAERYRIVGLLGRGGMGEVYRADDLKLGQPVALKFLPAALERDESRLARFLNEVKLARQVSHPNVCRVYDVGELEGQHFLSMEYVDGEDLGSLLRRIGHLPRDKAVQLSRQLCWGLAAAHELGILHRDIKPANVMIDGRGNTKLTDFGLADLAGTIAGAEVVAGTPAYMAPEQLAGKAVSARSDVYSLGLVMYELFTGKQPFDRAKTPRDLARVRSESTPTDPSSHVESFDPVVERVILRCLEQDPANRPASALAVAAALPGGDPLSAALAAGETPSPEMVAEAGEKGGMSPLIGLPLWTVVVAGLIGLVAIVGQGYRKLPLPNAPEELIVRARDVIRDLGHDNKTGDHFFDLWINHTAVNYFAENHTGDPSTFDLSSMQPSPARFLYRESPLPLVPRNRLGWVGFDNPPHDVPGMTRVLLDGTGRLLTFEAVPPTRDESQPRPDPDWEPLFDKAGLNPADFEPVDPTWTLTRAYDGRWAWSGFYPGQAEVPIHVEAGAHRGNPAAFAVYGPWFEPWVPEPDTRPVWQRILDPADVVYVVVMLFAIVLAWRNLRQGRADRRGAMRVGLFVFIFDSLYWLLATHHVADSELLMIQTRIGFQLRVAGEVWLLYVALEPHARRLWPDVLISWSRLVAGRLRDPRIGRDILVGAAVGLFGAYVEYLTHRVDGALGAASAMPDLPSGRGLAKGRQVLGGIFDMVPDALNVPFFILLLLLLLRLVLRNRFAAVAALFAIGTVLSVPGESESQIVAWTGAAFIVGLMVTVLIRFGILALVAGGLYNGLDRLVLTSDLSVWYAGRSVLAVVVFVSLATYALVIALRGRRLFSESLLDG